jgi:hypothetical protein
MLGIMDYNSMFSSLGAIVCFIAIIQFIPLAFNLHLDGSPCEEALESTGVKIVAGFCLGFLLLIPIDIIFDLVNGNYHLLTSRVFLFLVSSAYSIIVIIPHGDETKVGVYACYLGFATVSVAGRLFMDLHIHDTTNTWTFSRVVCFTLLIGFMCSLSAANQVLQSTIIPPISTACYCVFFLLFSVVSVLCAKQLYQGRPTGRIMPIGLAIGERWKRLTHDECFLLLLITTGSTFFLLLAMLPRFFSQHFHSFRERHQDLIIVDQIIRVTFATAVALSPSLVLKFKAKTLQNDLDLKRVFVRYVSHEIR